MVGTVAEAAVRSVQAEVGAVAADDEAAELAVQTIAIVKVMLLTQRKSVQTLVLLILTERIELPDADVGISLPSWGHTGWLRRRLIHWLGRWFLTIHEVLLRGWLLKLLRLRLVDQQYTAVWSLMHHPGLLITSEHDTDPIAKCSLGNDLVFCSDNANDIALGARC